MKKFLAVLVVLALTVFTTAAFADVTVSGSIDIRSRDFNNTSDFNDKLGDAQRDTQTRVRLNVDGKHENVKGRITFENDWDSWGANGPESTIGLSKTATSITGQPARPWVREAWIDFNIPGLPAHIKAGHQMLQLGHGWFFRSMKYGSDAWVVGMPGKNTIAFVDVKAFEFTTSQADDVDFYVLLDVFKIDDNNTVGIDVTDVKDRRGQMLGGADTDLYNVGLFYTGKLGPVSLKAELDIQTGTTKDGVSPGNDLKHSGNQIVVQGSMPLDPVTLSFMIGRGTGDDSTTSDKNEGIVNVMDADPHYSFMYEYKTTAGGNVAGKKGLYNTTVLGIGGMMKVAKSVDVGVDLWYFMATEDVNNLATADPTDKTSDLGTEIDVKVNWKVYDNLSWNWNVGYLMPGDGMAKTVDATDAALGIQGILSYKF